MGTDLERWLFKMEEFFELYETPMKQRVKLASLHMEGDASDWNCNKREQWKNIKPHLKSSPLRYKDSLDLAYHPNSNSAQGGSNGGSKGGLISSIAGSNVQQSSVGSTTNSGGKMPPNYRRLMAEEIHIKRAKEQFHPSTLRVTGSYQGTTVMVLIDNGSTHNFIKREMAMNLKLPMTAVKPFKISMALTWCFGYSDWQN
ncbi:RVP_2 domain-containing protein [Senna tora]|uniref:RVP_2 domain-containing protein n=1 Tax=Senna tora TaxID=362788 RepID=A0A834XHA1_9FABA|nr:RVP_2 domain-containing protein [Senna tora]